MATVVSLINMKGGVGKTTLAMQLALAAGGSHKLRVLAIDLDPQSNPPFPRRFLAPNATSIT